MNRTEKGKLGEEAVCRYLEDLGYVITARNYRIKGGEIDIIAENADYIVFTEVKTRMPGSLASGFDAIDKRKKGLIIRAASDYCCKHPTMLQPRFDVAQVIAGEDRVFSIDYIQNAYDTTGYNFIF